nr:hypothetical protein [Nonlabens ulvanivorans]
MKELQWVIPWVDVSLLSKLMMVVKHGGKLQCTELPDFVPGEAAFAASNSNIKILGDQVWLVTGGAMARVIYSDNRGSNWQIFNTPIIAGGEMTGIYAVDFYDKDLGVIIGGDWNKKEDNKYNKAITRNGGKSWNLLSNDAGPGYCSDIIFIPDTNGQELLAVGSPGICGVVIKVRIGNNYLIKDFIRLK